MDHNSAPSCDNGYFRYELSDRPRWTQEKALACDMATKQDVLDVQQMIEEADGYVLQQTVLKTFVTATVYCT